MLRRQGDDGAMPLKLTTDSMRGGGWRREAEVIGGAMPLGEDIGVMLPRGDVTRRRRCNAAGCERRRYDAATRRRRCDSVWCRQRRCDAVGSVYHDGLMPQKG
jgi:hypothetical protein